MHAQTSGVFRRASRLVLCALLASCGGGGGGDAVAPAPSVPLATPTVTITASSQTPPVNSQVTLTWAAVNATSCTASGAWSGTLPTSGSQSVLVQSTGTYTLSCGGSGGATSAAVALAVTGTYALTVQVRYEAPGPPVGGRPAWENVVVAPVPHVFVELLDAASGAVVGSAYADASGNATFADLDITRDYLPRVQSKILTSAPVLDFMVLNNTRPVDAARSRFRERYRPYELSPPVPFRATGGGTQVTTVTATTGWNGSTLVDQARAGGLFGLLANAVKQARSFALTTGGADWRPLTILWSTVNRGGLTSSSAVNYDDGVVTGSGGFYSNAHRALDAGGSEVGAGAIFEDFIFLSGDPSWELHELYPFVMNHEMGHFVQARFSRLTGPGGEHSATEFSDFRLAYVEGVANAIALLVAESPVVVRTRSSNGQIVAQVDNWSVGRASWPLGWYQETTVARILWRLFDPAGPLAMSREAVLGPMVQPQFRDADWLPSIWAHLALLKQANPARASAIDAVATPLGVVSAGNDAWGATETNTGNRAGSDVLPPYVDLQVGVPLQLCSAGAPREYNRSGNRRLLRLTGALSRTLTVTGPANTDPDLQVYNRAACGGLCPVSLGGSTVETEAISYPGTTLVEVGDCAVAYAENEDDVASCGATAPPARQCWTITLN